MWLSIPRKYEESFPKAESVGFNPNIISADLITQEIEKNPHLFLIKNQLDYVYFYGSDAELRNALLVETQLQKVFPYAKVTVKEDLTAAAYAAYKGKRTWLYLRNRF